MHASKTGTATVLALALTGSILVCARPDSLASPCRTQADTATLALNTVQQFFVNEDSAATLTLDTISTVIISDSVTCQAVIDSYNGALEPGDSLSRVTSGFVIRAAIPTRDTSFALYLPEEDGRPEEIANFSKTFVFWNRGAGLR